MRILKKSVLTEWFDVTESGQVTGSTILEGLSFFARPLPKRRGLARKDKKSIAS